VRRSRFLYALALVLLLAPGVVSAQFGHPLKGQWSGQWGPADNQKRLLLDLHWDGKTITGSINPGADDAATVKDVTFNYDDPSAWKVKIQAEGKDASGKPVTISVDGVLENIGAYSRLFHGTWVQGGQKGDFTVTRN
jgi:hypothetical protein